MERVLVVGWDGADWEIVDDLIGRGLLPTAAAMVSEGASGTLMSTTPTHSWSAWASFLTGVHPSRHGVFDFVERDPHDPQRRIPVSSGSIDAPSFLESLSAAGHEVRAANIPVTFPPLEIRGRMISGVAIPPGADFVTPSSFEEELRRRAPFPLNGMEWSRYEQRPDQLISEARDYVAQRGAAFRVLLEGDWSVATCVFVAPDRVQHPFGAALLPSHPDFPERSQAPETEALYAMYADLDRELARLIDIAGDDTTVILMSDHGFRPVSRVADLDRILIAMGFASAGSVSHAARTVRSSPLLRKLGRSRLGHRLKQNLRAPSSLDWAKTRAYRSVAGGVSLNARGREIHGVVSQSDMAMVLGELTEGLLAYVDPTTGERPVREVVPRADLPQGLHRDMAPDLMVRPSPLWSLAPTRSSDPRTSWPSGSHRREGIIAAIGAGVQPGDLGTPHIVDLAPTLLASQGLVDADSDGTAIAALLGGRAQPELALAATHGGMSRDTQGLSRNDEDSITQHLRDLGYIE